MQMLNSIGLSINSGLPPAVLCATDCSPLIPSYSSSFQSASLCTHPPVCSPSSGAGTCQTEAPSCAHGPAQAWELSQQGTSASPCSSLLACAQGHSSYLSCVRCLCVPTSQGSCLASPTLCPCHFWCKNSPTWLTCLSKDIFAPYSQIDPVPRVFFFYSGRKKPQYFELTSQSALRCNCRKKVLS